MLKRMLSVLFFMSVSGVHQSLRAGQLRQGQHGKVLLVLNNYLFLHRLYVAASNPRLLFSCNEQILLSVLTNVHLI